MRRCETNEGRACTCTSRCLTLVHAKGLAPPSEYAARGLIVIVVKVNNRTREFLSDNSAKKSTFRIPIVNASGFASFPQPVSRSLLFYLIGTGGPVQKITFFPCKLARILLLQSLGISQMFRYTTRLPCACK
jgi:hypothetical protein